MSFELIKDPAKTVAPLQLQKLKEELLILYEEREWIIPAAEIIESLDSASILVALKKQGRLCGFFTGRTFSENSIGQFYYLERLIIAKNFPLQVIVVMAFLLVFNLPGLGERELIISSITRLKIIGTLVEFFGDSYFCSSTGWPAAPAARSRAKAVLNGLSCETDFELNSVGLLKDVFYDEFNHNQDSRLIASHTPLGEHDAALVLNKVPAGENALFTCLQQSSVTRSSRLLTKLVELWKNKKLFTKIKGGPNGQK